MVQKEKAILMLNKESIPIFINGPIEIAFISDILNMNTANTGIGATSIFLGQVRGDEIRGKKVISIEYFAYEEMALEVASKIKENIIGKYSLINLHLFHSLGNIRPGEISLAVFATSSHRKSALDGCEEAVELIKETLPVWSKEFLEDNSFRWKLNK